VQDIEFGFHVDGDVWSAEQMAFVEESGFDILTTGEHIVFFRPILDVMTVLSFAAAATKTIKLAPSTIILPLRHPTIMAKELSSLDQLSNGRLIASIGIGGDYPREFAACGVSTKERGVRANESLEIMRKYWTGERFDYHGKIFQLEDVDMIPTPVQPGGPPIWVCGRTEPAMKRAARLGDGWQPYMYTPDMFRESVTKVHDYAGDLGRELTDDFAFTSFAYVSMASTSKEGRDNAVEQLSFRFNLPFEKMVDKYCAYGTSEQIIESLASYISAGATKIVIALVMPPEQRLEYVNKFATEILPELRKLKRV
jgi:probable F420-dependent oxidoreductase